MYLHVYVQCVCKFVGICLVCICVCLYVFACVNGYECVCIYVVCVCLYMFGAHVCLYVFLPLCMNILKVASPVDVLPPVVDSFN